MTGSKLVAAEGMAVVSIITTIVNDIDLGLPKAPVGTLSLLFAIAAFALALSTGSPVVSISLLAKGLIDTWLAAASSASGAKIGLAFGLLVLAFGAVVALITIRKTRSATPMPKSGASQVPSLLEASARLVVVLSATMPSLALMLMVPLLALRPTSGADSALQGAPADDITHGVTPSLSDFGIHALPVSLP
jgi:hypothetical protein